MGDFLYPPPNMEPVAIYNDGGGVVEKYQQAAMQYRLEGREVRISGSCRSACVLALSVPNVCVSPGAVVKAHQAYETYSGKERPDITAEMMGSLPYAIRARLEPNVRREYWSGSILGYSDLVSLGVRPCGQKAHKASYKVASVTPVSLPEKQVSNKVNPKTKQKINPVTGLFKIIGGIFK